MSNKSLIKQVIQNVRRLLNSIMLRYNLKRIQWKKIEHFDDVWKERIELMSKFILTNKEVIDFGCGPMWLKNMVHTKKYYPVDYCDRGNDCIVCDFNKYEFPNIAADVAFASGVLEYVVDVDWFIKNIVKNTSRCIISYVVNEECPDILLRKKKGWVNNLTKDELTAVFQKNGSYLSKYEYALNKYHIFIFDKQ